MALVTVPSRKDAKRVAGIRDERVLCAAEVISSAGQRARGGVVTGADQLVSGFESVLPDDFGEVVLNGEVLADVDEAGKSGEAEADIEIGEGRAGNVRNAELLCPVLPLREGGLAAVAPVVAGAEFVVGGGAEDEHVREHAVDLVDGRGLRVGIDLAPCELRLVIALPRAMAGLRVAAEDAVRRGELVVDFAVPARAAHVLDGVEDEIFGGTGGGGGARPVGRP